MILSPHRVAATSATATANRSQAMTLLAFRICIAPLFYYSGILKVANFAATAASIPGGGQAFGQVLIAGAIVVELGVVSALLIGLFARQAALAVALYVMAATFMYHQFWLVPEEQVVGQVINFLKNLGLIAGLSLIVAFGPGPYSIGANWSREAAG